VNRETARGWGALHVTCSLCLDGGGAQAGDELESARRRTRRVFSWIAARIGGLPPLAKRRSWLERLRTAGKCGWGHVSTGGVRREVIRRCEGLVPRACWCLRCETWYAGGVRCEAGLARDGQHEAEFRHLVLQRHIISRAPRCARPLASPLLSCSLSSSLPCSSSSLLLIPAPAEYICPKCGHFKPSVRSLKVASP
jgi:hypothetical protein